MIIINCNIFTIKYKVHYVYVITICVIILLTKTTAAQNGVALSYHKVRGLYFLAVFFLRSIDNIEYETFPQCYSAILYGHSKGIAL